MINKENILQTAQALVRQYNLPLKLIGAEEGTEEVTIYFTAKKRPQLRELAQELEFQLNLPIKLERIKKSESGKIGEVDVLGKYPCCAAFLRKCPFGGKYGCGYGLGTEKTEDRERKTEIREHPPASSREASRAGKTEDKKPPKPPKKAKSKRKKVVRRVVLKR